MKLMLSLTICFLNFFHVFGAFLVIFIFYHNTDLYCFLFFACTFRCVKYDQFLISCGEGDILYTSDNYNFTASVCSHVANHFLYGLILHLLICSKKLQSVQKITVIVVKKKYLTSMIFESINLNKNITVTICLLIFKPKSLLSEFSRWRL